MPRSRRSAAVFRPDWAARCMNSRGRLTANRRQPASKGLRTATRASRSENPRRGSTLSVGGKRIAPAGCWRAPMGRVDSRNALRECRVAVLRRVRGGCRVDASVSKRHRLRMSAAGQRVPPLTRFLPPLRTSGKEDHHALCPSRCRLRSAPAPGRVGPNPGRWRFPLTRAPPLLGRAERLLSGVRLAHARIRAPVGAASRTPAEQPSVEG